jgi:hypothetical protein
MPSLTHVVSGTVINVQDNNAGRISYQGVGVAGWHGYLDYQFNFHALEIHAMIANPQGCGAGAVLVWMATLKAMAQHRNRMEAFAVAATARGFYLALGFHPAREGREAIENAHPDFQTPSVNVGHFETRLVLGRSIATWDGETTQISQICSQKVAAIWQ